TFDFLAAAGGANDASAHVQYMIANCPRTRLVLGGYSQGAAVIGSPTLVVGLPNRAMAATKSGAFGGSGLAKPTAGNGTAAM
ncbi:hypothetical protein C6A85_09945, partial [Mycobacterium sp. ITM-2017-0098]